MVDISERGYVNPEFLVSTEWVYNNLENHEIRIVESNEDPLLYPSGHIPNAVEIDWVNDLNNPLSRDYLNKAEFEQLMSKKGISNDMTVIFYGDKSNWWAAYALWVFQLFGHQKVKLMDGGRLKWDREGRALTKDIPAVEKTNYTAPIRDDKTLRALKNDVLLHLEEQGQLVDVRSPEEYSGKRMHMPDYPNEGALRGGHIPSAKSIPWSKAANEDGTFKTYDELLNIYNTENLLKKDINTIAYCRIGERSSHTWFVLKYLLGFTNVRNYDGSWTEWGNSVGVPIEK
ncbi:MAG: sulfurtransferase [Candidatus Heimdallarchaeota archaeon]|nr:sulfurtransferase [Candidatus Heimdallarchaeota archaeon]MDH5646831.1 sulfurtransferase [Candidatus Heimdallarchaeota archaeon]